MHAQLLSAVQNILSKYGFHEINNDICTSVYMKERLAAQLVFAIQSFDKPLEQNQIPSTILDIFHWVQKNIKLRLLKLSQIGLNYIFILPEEIPSSNYESFIDMHAIKDKKKLAILVATDLILKDLPLKEFDLGALRKATKDIIVQSISVFNTRDNTFSQKTTWILVGTVRKILRDLKQMELSHK